MDTFPNIKFANNIHSYGGYFMWAPGTYKDDGQRTTAPAPNIGIEKYFFEAGEKILTRIKEHRNTVILPERTGPIADVLYSAAGNSADDQWYRKGIISYSFETGADRFITNPTTGAISLAITGFQPCFAGLGTGGGTGTCNSNMINEGRDQAMEFASATSAWSSPRTTTRRTPRRRRPRSRSRPRRRAATRSTSGSTGTTRRRSSTTRPTAPRRRCPRAKYNNQRARSIGEVLQVTKLGRPNQVVGRGHQGQPVRGPDPARPRGGQRGNGTVGGSVPATLSLTLGAPASFGAFTPGVAKEYTATTEANVISTAGDATLSVVDPSSTNTGKLVNGAFALPQPLQGLGVVKTWTAPTSNEKVPVTFKQQINANDALRTGSYSKTLTFTLSTTTP